MSLGRDAAEALGAGVVEVLEDAEEDPVRQLVEGPGLVVPRGRDEGVRPAPRGRPWTPLAKPLHRCRERFGTRVAPTGTWSHGLQAEISATDAPGPTICSRPVEIRLSSSSSSSFVCWSSLASAPRGSPTPAFGARDVDIVGRVLGVIGLRCICADVGKIRTPTTATVLYFG